MTTRRKEGKTTGICESRREGKVIKLRERHLCSVYLASSLPGPIRT